MKLKEHRRLILRESQEQVAERAGVSRSIIARLEIGSYKTSPKTHEKIAFGYMLSWPKYLKYSAITIK